MSTVQRRNSQRLASALEALSSDLDVEATETEVETDETVTSSDQSPKEYMDQDGRGYGDNSEDAAKQYLGQDQEEFEAAIAELQGASDCEDQDCQEAEQEDDFQSAFNQAMAETEQEDVEQAGQEQKETEQASIEQGDPGVDQVGSQATHDSDDVRNLGKDYGIDFSGDEDLEPSIRNVPGRTQKQAKIKKLIARIENVANHLEKTGRKKLAYRLDVVCNNLEQKYSIK